MTSVPQKGLFSIPFFIMGFSGKKTHESPQQRVHKHLSIQIGKFSDLVCVLIGQVVINP